MHTHMHEHPYTHKLAKLTHAPPYLYQSDCVGVSHYADWVTHPGSSHPRTFMPSDFTPKLVKKLHTGGSALFSAKARSWITQNFASQCFSLEKSRLLDGLAYVLENVHNPQQANL